MYVYIYICTNHGNQICNSVHIAPTPKLMMALYTSFVLVNFVALTITVVPTMKNRKSPPKYSK